MKQCIDKSFKFQANLNMKCKQKGRHRNIYVLDLIMYICYIFLNYLKKLVDISFSFETNKKLFKFSINCCRRHRSRELLDLIMYIFIYS